VSHDPSEIILYADLELNKKHFLLLSMLNMDSLMLISSKEQHLFEIEILYMSLLSLLISSINEFLLNISIHFFFFFFYSPKTK